MGEVSSLDQQNKELLSRLVIGLQPTKTRAELDSSTVLLETRSCLKQIFYEYHPLTTYQDARRVRLVDGLV